VHRVYQLVGYLTARVAPGEADLVHRALPATAWELFESMPVADRRHALDVANRLRAHGHDDGDLLAAALLHDAAKGHRLRLWHRVGGVLIGAVSARLLARMANPDERSAGYPWHLFLHHPELSAASAERAGCTPRTATLIRGRTDPIDAPTLAALHAADEAS
jgi:hypothetical protein